MTFPHQREYHQACVKLARRESEGATWGEVVEKWQHFYTVYPSEKLKADTIRDGLKGMTEEVLQATITKGPKTTNWEAQELTDRQILYAATDAWIGLKIYQKLTSDS